MEHRAPETLPSLSTKRTSIRAAVELSLLIGLLVFSPLLDGGTTHTAVMIIRLVILSLLGCHMATRIRAGTLALPPSDLAAPVLAFLGLAAISTLGSPYTHQSLQWLIVLLSYAVLLYALLSLMVGWERMAILLTVLVGMGLFEAGWAIWQGVWTGSLRPSGTFFNPNFLASYLAAIWGVVLGYACYSRSGSSSDRKVLVIAAQVLILSILMVAIVWTGSRGGILATLVATAVVMGMRFGRRSIALLTLLGIIGLLVPNTIRDRLQAEHLANPATYARLMIWQNSLREMVEHPFGIGLGLYQYMSPRYMFPVEGQIARYGKVAHTAHNEYLQMAVELGAPSILVFAWGVYAIGRQARAALKERLRQWQRGALVGTIAGIAGILMHAAVDSNLHEPAVAILLALLVAIVTTSLRLSAPLTSPVRMIPVQPRLVWSALAMGVIGLLTVATLRMGLAWAAFENGSRAASQRDFTRAIGYYRTAIALDSGKALYHSSIAGAYFQIFERTHDSAAADAAMSELHLAMTLNPLDGRLPALAGHVHASLASLAADREERTLRLRSALSSYQRAVQLEPFSAFHRLELGRLYLALGDREQGEASIRRAVELEPNLLPARAVLARLYLQSERTEEAILQYREILERQRRYAGWSKDRLEERFLTVDVTALHAELGRRLPST